MGRYSKRKKSNDVSLSSIITFTKKNKANTCNGVVRGNKFYMAIGEITPFIKEAVSKEFISVRKIENVRCYE